MSPHPYLRAYMAGIAVPTFLLPVGLTVFAVARFVYHIPVPIERVIIFPMAIVPNMFGVWNLFYVWLQPKPRWPIGLHGALLPFVLAPLALAILTALGVARFASAGIVYFDSFTIPYTVILAVFPLTVMVYYLVWKYIIGFFNRLLGLA